MATIEERLDLLAKAEKDPVLQQELMELCKRDIIFWFEHFCWTFDPRLKRPKSPHLPFNLYPFQKQVVRALQHCVETGEGALIEKSRDMGLTWLVLLVFQYYWIFFEGSDFHLGSKKQEDVDKLGVKSTLFQKLRYNGEWLPVWMLPTLRKNEDTTLKLINPVNGNAITGQAATEDFGRSGRYKAMLLDEFARHPYGQAAYESASQSSDCIFLLFTPYGKANHAYRLASADDLKNVPLQAEEMDEELEKQILLYA